MVLLRSGIFGLTRDRDKKKMPYYEDSVWTTRKEATIRSEQIENVLGHFTIIDQKKFTNAPDEYIVWSSQSKKKGTRFGKKTARRKALKGEE